MEDKIRKYAKFLIQGCLRIKENAKLFIIGLTLIDDFIKILEEEAQKLGIKEIEKLIINPFKQKELYLSKIYEELIEDPNFLKTKYNDMAREGYAFLNLYSPIPNFFQEVDKELLNKVNQYQLRSIKLYREYQNKGLIKWNISSVPNEIWANSLNLSENELWEKILDICLINEDNPIVAWQLKMENMRKRAEYLNSLNIDKLIYKNSLGTNLEIGLPVGYLFQSADGDNLVNMPTEEVFTSPDKFRVNGRVYASKTLIHNDSVIEDFWLEFKEGKVVFYDAVKGKEILKGILETDLGASYLGEVAIVDFDSPISKTGIVFNNTLYDENASCHLALGESFLECVKDGLKKSPKELEEIGLNSSHEHVDFFIGTKDLEIKAILQNGEEKVIMENGNFAWR